MKLKVGTRGSKLALLQTEIAIKKLRAANPKLDFEIKIIKTTGDKIRRKPLFAIESKGIFEKEIDQALLRDEIDFAVHSLKDVPVYEQHENILLAAVPERDDPREALISVDGSTLKELPKGAVIGTSSLRRMAQIKFLRGDLEVKPIRGNLDTRVRKVKQGEYDAIIVAKAGLDRMKLQSLASEVFPIDVFTPAAGQGALAVVARKDKKELIEIFEAINHPPTMAEVTAERSLIAALKGGCHFPVGAIGKAENNTLTLYGCIFTLDGSKKLSASASGSLKEAQALGEKVAHELLKQGAQQIADDWRKAYGLR
ncbi:hydroxymethylbilane synthase [Candidatus Bathyarchaeota archaeon]|nr:hydroxymethylbilane synthase [Candidatus Bathyarchaeota archaeon]